MRPRLLALALVATAPLSLAAVGSTPTALKARPAVVGTDDCPPGYGGTLDTGLDGGPGCRELGEEDEGLAKLAAPAAAATGARRSESGADRLRAAEQARAMRLSAAPVPDSTAEWKNIGPKPLSFDDPDYPQSQLGLHKVSGRVSAIAIDERDTTGNTLYVGTAGGGVWRSTNAGENWTFVSDDLPTLAVGALEVDPATGWVYVGTGEANTGTDNYAGLGLFRSKDDGQTWERNAEVPADTVMSHIEIEGPLVLVATSKGLWRSTDNGDTFADVQLPTNDDASAPSEKFLGNYVSDVRVKPGDPETIIAAVGWRAGGVVGNGLYKSTDGGDTWAKLDPAIFGEGSLSADKIGRTTLAYQADPEQTNSLWAVVQDPGKVNNENNPLGEKLPAPIPPKVPFTALNGVYLSNDDGETWELKATYETLVGSPGSSYVPTFTASQSGPGIQSWYNQFFAVDPADPTRVLLGLEEVFQNLTPGVFGSGPLAWEVIGRYFNTCSPVNVGCPVYSGTTTHPDQHAIDMIATDDGTTRLYVGNDGGIVRQDAGPTPGRFTNSAWTHLNEDLSTLQFHAAIMGGDGVVYGGMQDNGTAKIFEKDGEPYAVQVYGGDGFDVAVDPADSDLVYAETQTGVLRRSADGGVSWSTITPTGSLRPQFFTPFEMDPRDAEHLVFGTGQIWETASASSTASGNWTQVMDLGDPMSSNAVDVEGSAVYVAFCGECNASPNLAEGGEYDPAIFTGGIATNVKNGCARETESTECWHVAAAKGLPKRFVAGLSIDPDDPKTLYAAVSTYRRRFLYDTDAHDTGIVYVSHDGGETFTDLTGNLPETFAADVIVQGGRLILATDVGVFANSSKTSTTWVPFGTGLPAVPAYDLSLNPKGDTVVLATHGRSIWTLKVTGAVPVTPPAPVPPRPPRPAPRPPLPSTGAPAWLFVLPLLIPVALLLRRRRTT